MNLGKKILNNVFQNKEVISASIVGSYTESKNLDKVGDIDVVVVCKKLSKQLITKLIKNVYKINKGNLKKKIIVNSTFGPLKISSKKLLPVHLMIYDIKSHIDHVTSSPFTCYDWERSKLYKGISLKQIYPVRNLQLSDFILSRRSPNEYLQDLLKNRISIREYSLKNQKVIIKKKFVKIDKRNRGEFVYHIINFLIINLNKFIQNKNIKIRNNKFDNLFLKVTKNDRKLLKDFKNLKQKKEKKILFYKPEILILAEKFIIKYNKFLKNLNKEYVKLNFIRHAKTKENVNKTFVGSGSDPDIIYKKKYNKNFEKFDLIITSNLKRSKSTTRFFKAKKIVQNELINEINYGLADGMSFNELKKNYPNIINSWKKGIDIKYPKGENSTDVKRRVNKFFKYLKKINNKEKILIITHSFFLRVLLSVVLNFNLKSIYKLQIDHLKKFRILKKKNNFYSDLDRKDIKKFYNQLYD